MPFPVFFSFVFIAGKVREKTKNTPAFLLPAHFLRFCVMV